MNIMDTFCDEEKSVYFSTPSGSRFREKFIGRIDEKTGNVVLKSIGKIDVYEKIQSFKEETDLASLVERAINGDLTVFKEGVFGDFTNIPQSYGEALNLVLDAEREFNHLPQEIKDKFDNDWHKYIVTAGTDEWFEKFGVKKDEIMEKKEESEVNENGES